MGEAPSVHVFVSYSREDRSIVQRLVEAMTKRGLTIRWDENLHPGDALADRLTSMLDEAAAVVVAWSKASAQSRPVIDEARRAQAAGKLVPVSLSGIESVPVAFQTLNTIDLSGWDSDVKDPRFEKLIAELAGRVGQTPDSSATADKATPETGPTAPPDFAPHVQGTAQESATAAALLPLRPAALELLGFTLAIATARGDGAATNIDVVLASLARLGRTKLDKSELERAATSALNRALTEPSEERIAAALSAAGVSPSTLPNDPRATPNDPRLALLLEDASALAHRLGADTVWSHHLVGVALAGDPLPDVMLTALGVSQDRMRDVLRSAIAERWSSEAPAIWDEVLLTGDVELAAVFASDSVMVRSRARPGETPLPPVGDYLGVGVYVTMLATLIAKKATAMPVSIGLFGEWGSGKSHFMELMRQKVGTLAESAVKASESPYYADIVQVRFNAWHYADTNLWASLAAEFFRQLAQPDTDPIEERRKEVQERLAAAQQVRLELKASTSAAEARTTELRNRWAQASVMREQRTLRFNASLLRAVAEDSQIREDLTALAERLGFDRDERVKALQMAKDLQGIGDDVTATRRILTKRSLRLPFALLMLALVAFGLVLIAPADWTRWLRGGTVAAFTALLADIGVITGRARQLARDLRGVAERAEAVQSRVIESDTSLRNVAEELNRAEADEAIARARLDEVLALIAQLDRQLIELEPGRRLYQFLAERAASMDYRSQLGVVSLIRQDFEQLVALMQDWRRHPTEGDKTKPIDRIVLYIDDLDRLEPDQVVAVLQAVNLLLAMDLFVVVVGVDPRWLLRSLRRRYRRVLGASAVVAGDRDMGFSESTPQNYLEKIFQIPFVLPGMGEDGFTRLVEHLARPDLTPAGADGSSMEKVDTARSDTAEISPVSASDESDGMRIDMRQASAGAQSAEARSEVAAVQSGMHPKAATPISDAELSFLARLAPLVRTPRAATRMFNLYGLLRSTRDLTRGGRFLGSPNQSGDYQAVAQLLGILTAAPHLLGPLLWGRKTGGEIEPRALCRAPVTRSWASFIDALEPHSEDETWSNDVADSLSAEEVEAWKTLVDHIKSIRQHIDLDDIERYRLWGPRIARFSFLLSPFAAYESDPAH